MERELQRSRGMHTIAEIRVEPLGEGSSIRSSVERACALLEKSGLQCQVHDMGTNVEGELSQVLSGIAEIHRQLHAEGAQRLSTHLEIETRIDKEPHLGEGARKVQV